MGVRSAVTDDYLRFELLHYGLYYRIKSKLIASLIGTLRQRYVNSKTLTGTFTDLIGKARTRINRLWILMQIDQEYSGILIEIFRCAVARMCVRIQY